MWSTSSMDMHHGTQSIRKGREAQMGQCLGFGRRQARLCNRSCPKNSRYAFGDYYSLNLTWNYRNQITKKKIDENNQFYNQNTKIVTDPM